MNVKAYLYLQHIQTLPFITFKHAANFWHTLRHFSVHGVDWWLRWWGKTSQNHGQQWVYCSSPGWYVNVESHGDDGWGKLPTHPSELSRSPTSRDIWEHVGVMDEGEFFVWASKTHQQSLTWHKILWYGASSFTSHEREVCYRFLLPLKIDATRFEHVTLWSSGKHTNHYTEMTVHRVNSHL
jgi:hypothetical protein